MRSGGRRLEQPARHLEPGLGSGGERDAVVADTTKDRATRGFEPCAQRERAAAVPQARGDAQRQLRGRQVRGHGERVAHGLRIARADRQGRDLTAKLLDLVLVEHAAVLVDDERTQDVGVLIAGVGRVRRP